MNLVFGLRWKLAVAATLLISMYAIYDNSRRVLRLERQVCSTVQESNDSLDGIEYYRFHPAEKKAVEDHNRQVLLRFHCPILPEKSLLERITG